MSTNGEMKMESARKDNKWKMSRGRWVGEEGICVGKKKSLQNKQQKFLTQSGRNARETAIAAGQVRERERKRERGNCN